MNRSSGFPPIPAGTARAARRSIEENTPYSILAGEMHALFARRGLDTADDAGVGEPVQFLRRAVVTLLQEAEMLTDDQAEEATRARIEWKYALHLPLEYSGMRAHEFCLFRQKLFFDRAAGALFQTIQDDVAALGLWPHLPDERRPFDHIVSVVCRLNQSNWYSEAMRQALEVLAAFHPELLRQIAVPHWYVRYAESRPEAAKSGRLADGDLPLEAVRQDIAYLLSALASCEDPAPAQLPEVRRLRRGWQQDCDICDRRDRLCVYCTRCVVGADIARGSD